MTHPFPLQPLVHLSQQKNDAAIKKLGQLNRLKQSAQSKLDMLHQYRNDYQAKFRLAESNGMELQELLNFKNFICRLDDAIEQQSMVVSQAQLTLEQGRNELAETQRRMKSFDTLSQRHTMTEKKQEAKSEQLIQDEHNGRRSGIHKTVHSEEN
jgi:flagellar FliJ protein